MIFFNDAHDVYAKRKKRKKELSLKYNLIMHDLFLDFKNGSER